MKPLRTAISIMAVLVFLHPGIIARAQEPEVRFDHPLQQSAEPMGAFIQDSDGFFWMGTKSGLIKYNGMDFQIYKQGPNSLSDNVVCSLLEDQDGILWIGTSAGGLNKYDKETDTFTYYQHDPNDPNSLSSNEITCPNPQALFEDNSGALWIGTNEGLNKFDRHTEVFTHYKNDPENLRSLSHNHVFAIYEDSAGTLWVGTKAGLNRFDPGAETFIRYLNDPTNLDSISDNWINAIIEDKSGVLWIGTNNGLNRFDKDGETFARYMRDPQDPNTMGSRAIYSMFEDSTGTLWLAHSVGEISGLSSLDPARETFTRYAPDPNDPYSVSSLYIMSVYEDRAGVLWIINGVGTLDKYDKEAQKFNLHSNQPDNPNSLSPPIAALFEDREGFLWFGTVLDGLVKLDQTTGTITRHPSDPGDPQGIPASFISAIFEDSDGTFWLGSLGGTLSIFDRETGKCTKHYVPDPDDPTSILPSQQVRYILEDKEDPNILWLAAINAGVEKFDKTTETFTHYVPDPLDTNSLLNNILFTLYDDGKGNLWIPSWGGLDKLDKQTETFTHYTHDPDDPNSISSNKTVEVYEDTAGRLWVTTYGGGLNLFDPQQETFTHYTEDNGFPTNEINSILEDDDGNLWLGTGAGIVKFNPDDGTVKQYTTSDGLQGDLFFEGARLKARDGTMWFSGMRGVNSFHPDQITANPTIPPVYVVSFKQGGEEMDLGKAPERAKGITLDWRKNFFEFELAALNYTHPEKNQFAYFLEGFDKEWYQAGTQRFGRYSGLPGGEYTLRIKGSNNDGVWNEEGTSIKVTVIPPFWETWWFRGAAILILIAAVLGIYAWRIQATDAQKRHLQVLVAERTRDLEAAQAELLRKERLATLGQVAATVSHEIRNPLATIQISATVVDHKTRGKGLDVEPVLDRIQRNITRCDNIIGELLDYARTFEPNLRLVRFDDWLNQVLDEQDLPEGITLSRDLASEVEISLDPERFRRLIINLVDNAWQVMLELPETSDQAQVLSVQSSVVDNRLKVVISDTGPGISPDVKSRIFEPLYSTKNFGVGLGLSVVEEIVKQHGGEIEISSEAGKGTQVTVWLPLRSS